MILFYGSLLLFFSKAFPVYGNTCGRGFSTLPTKTSPKLQIMLTGHPSSYTRGRQINANSGEQSLNLRFQNTTAHGQWKPCPSWNAETPARGHENIPSLKPHNSYKKPSDKDETDADDDDDDEDEEDDEEEEEEDDDEPDATPLLAYDLLMRKTLTNLSHQGL